VAILHEIIEELSAEEIAATLPSSLEQSCLVPMLEVYLRNDSFTDMVDTHIINSLSLLMPPSHH
jgi:hypothetical protein